MDEASNGVDPISRKNLYAYLKQLKNTSSLLITHRIHEAEKICDRIAIMAEGKFLDLDSPGSLKERHGIVYILQLEPASTSQLTLKKINSFLTQSLPFCKRVQEAFPVADWDYYDDNSSGGDRSTTFSFRPTLTYRFDYSEGKAVNKRAVSVQQEVLSVEEEGNNNSEEMRSGEGPKL